MAKKLPLLLIIPHSGLNIPEELSGYDAPTPLELFFESDGGAERIFSFGDNVSSVINTGISRLFVDTDRNYKSLYPLTGDGVIKKSTSMNRPVFKKNYYPDEIAIANILKRYYTPFHQSIKAAIEENNPRLILECHTHMPVGPANAPDKGMPRPLVITGYTGSYGAELFRTGTADMALELAAVMGKALEKEGDTVASSYSLDNKSNSGYILNTYGRGSTPMLYLSISRSLFLSDRYFDIKGIRMDMKRLDKLRNIIFTGIEKFFKKI
jgi:N-formylglutamate deformylase